MISILAALAVALHAEPLKPAKVLSGSELHVHGRYAWSLGKGNVGVWDMDSLKQMAVVEVPEYAAPAGPNDGASLTPLVISADGRWLVLEAKKIHWDGGWEPSGSSKGSAELLLASVPEQRVVRRLARLSTGDCVSVGISNLCPSFESVEISPDGNKVLYWERTDHSAAKTAKSAIDQYHDWSNLIKRWKYRVFVSDIKGSVLSQSRPFEAFLDTTQDPVASGVNPPKPAAGFLADGRAALLTADDAGCQVKTFDGARISFLEDCTGEQEPSFDAGLARSGKGNFRVWDPLSGAVKFKLPVALRDWYAAGHAGDTVVASDDLSAVMESVYAQSATTAAASISVTDASTGRVLWSGDVEMPHSATHLSIIDSHYSRKDGRLIVQSMEDATGPKAYRNYVAVYRIGAALPAPADETAAAQPDVDVDAPPAVKNKLDPGAFAIVIGVEKYRQEGIPSVDFASHDARTVYSYLTRAMGFDTKNVVLLTDEKATRTDLSKYLGKWLQNRVDAKSRVFVYYAGHGAPNPATGEGFLMPYEADPAYLEDTAFPIARLYADLAKLPTKDVTVVLDACFSGQGGRSLIAKGERPLVAVRQAEGPANAVVLAAASGAQISASDPQRRHGLLTEYLLEALHGAADARGDGKVTGDEVFAFVKPAVERAARLQNVEQTPTLSGNPGARPWIELK